MGTEQAGLSAAVTQNIEKYLKDKDLNKNQLVDLSGIASSTLYRNIKCPEKFTLLEVGKIADALDVSLVDLVRTDERP